MAAGNPLLWRLGGHGGSSAYDARNEATGTYTDHIPTILAGILIGAGLVLIGLDRADFKFAGAGSLGGRG